MFLGVGVLYILFTFSWVFGVSSGGCSSIRVLGPSRCVLFGCCSGVIRWFWACLFVVLLWVAGFILLYNAIFFCFLLLDGIYFGGCFCFAGSLVLVRCWFGVGLVLVKLLFGRY